MNYEMFKKEFEGFGEIRKPFDWLYTIEKGKIKLGYDNQLEEFVINKNGTMLDFGLDIKTAKLILKVLQ
jgi:hypothetical protein